MRFRPVSRLVIDYASAGNGGAGGIRYFADDGAGGLALAEQLCREKNGYDRQQENEGVRLHRNSSS